MNKTELIKQMSVQSKLTQKDCLLCLNALKDVLASSLKRGEMVSLVGFGKFYMKHYPQRKSYNPQTQQVCSLKARFLPVFKVSNALKSKI